MPSILAESIADILYQFFPIPLFAEQTIYVSESAQHSEKAFGFFLSWSYYGFHDSFIVSNFEIGNRTSQSIQGPYSLTCRSG
jgi:hypothetical protein